MKRVKRSVLEDGSNQPKLELRQSPISANIQEKPGTHHGYQSTHYTGAMAMTDPMEKQNMTSNSFNQTEAQDLWRGTGTGTGTFLPDMSMSSNF